MRFTRLVYQAHRKYTTKRSPRRLKRGGLVVTARFLGATCFRQESSAYYSTVLARQTGWLWIADDASSVMGTEQAPQEAYWRPVALDHALTLGKTPDIQFNRVPGQFEGEHDEGNCHGGQREDISLDRFHKSFCVCPASSFQK